MLHLLERKFILFLSEMLIWHQHSVVHTTSDLLFSDRYYGLSRNGVIRPYFCEDSGNQ